MPLLYIAQRAAYQVLFFLSDWYIGGFRIISRKTVDLLESFDRSLALRITFQNIFQPLYQDRTIIGRILGFFFRSARIILGLALYLFIIGLGLALYLTLALTPLYIIYWGFWPHL